MTKEERLQKVLKRIGSAILHTETLKEEMNDDDIDLAVGHLKRAQEIIHSLYYAIHHEGRKVEQMELFS